jgi:hypothetical protein
VDAWLQQRREAKKLATVQELVVSGNPASPVVTISEPPTALTRSSPPPFDWKRTLDMTLIRAFVMGPFLTVYFPFLVRLSPGTTALRVASRVAIDQVIGAPVSITLTFVAAAVLQGRPDTIQQRMEEQLLRTWKTGAGYWPIVHSLNFAFVPLIHQPLVAHAASLWWNAVLSYRANTALSKKETHFPVQPAAE